MTTEILHISVSFAVPMEAADFCRYLRRMPALKRAKVRYFFTGIGMEEAREETRRHLEKVQPDILIIAGFCGGLDESLQVGEVIVGGNVSTLSLSLSGFRRVRLLTAPRLVTLPTNTDCEAVDMESAAIFATARAAGVEVLTLRAVSDTPSRPIPVPLEISYDLWRQRPRPFALLTWLAGNPRQVGPFFRFMDDLRLARRHLAEALEKSIEHLLSENGGPAV